MRFVCPRFIGTVLHCRMDVHSMPDSRFLPGRCFYDLTNMFWPRKSALLSFLLEERTPQFANIPYNFGSRGVEGAQNTPPFLRKKGLLFDHLFIQIYPRPTGLSVSSRHFWMCARSTTSKEQAVSTCACRRAAQRAERQSWTLDSLD